jgi:hypothetical protein
MKDVAIDMTGFRSGKLVAIAKAEGRSKKRAYWLCQCDCGNYRIVMGKYLRHHEVKSCGCLHRQQIGGHAKHGHARQHGISQTYTTWAGMIQRCCNPKNPGYYKYGARGIRIARRWFRFENFLHDMGERPTGKTIDRIDNTGDYKPGNCRWATPKEQANNSRRVRMITFKGKTQNLSDWAKEIGITSGTLYVRLKTWPLERALEEGA